ncbi:MAG: hypothetical protein IKG18_05715 [Atopobiaceae bacterium]|nr:hypothetical protein [Atopobiaceae bacterium]
MFTFATTRKGFFALATSMAAMLAGCAAEGQDDAAQTEAESGAAGSAEPSARESITDDSNGGHAIAVSATTADYASVDVTKTGDDDGDEADFYGTNAAVYAEEGATLNLDDITVTTNGAHANAVFSYGEGSTINISNSTIETSSNNSGAIMVTGGGTLIASNVTAHTVGNSSAPIRSDRGGGLQQVTGGSFTSDGMGSPVIYSTADVQVTGASLESTSAQGVVVEGKNSVALTDCDLVASNTSKNSDKSDWYQAVMIYQSMSGDAAEGAASFLAKGGTITNAHGDVFFVNNTVCTIGLEGVSITNEDTEGNFLRAAAAGWGNEGSNGGQITLKARGQQLDGAMLVDEVSNLNLYLSEGSTFVGSINPDGAAGEVYVEVEDGSTWELAADSYITSLTCGDAAIKLNGFVLTVGEAAYEEGTTSEGEPIEVQVSESTGGPGGNGEPPEKPGEGGPGGPGQGSEPPEKPSGNGEPPEKPSGDGEPPEKPAGE